VEYKIKMSAALKDKGAFVLPKNARRLAREDLIVGEPIILKLNGENLGEKRLNSDYRIVVGKALSDIINNTSDVKIKIEGNVINITAQ